MSETTRSDVIVIGAGIAGASVADALASECSVVVLEREARGGQDEVVAPVSALEEHPSLAARDPLGGVIIISQKETYDGLLETNAVH